MRLIITILLTLGIMSSKAQQTFDFDSLIQTNPLFEHALRMAADTFQIFGTEEPLEFAVATDFKQLIKNKYKDIYQDAVVKYQVSDSLILTRQVRIKPRGEFRLKKCQYPPLRVNVKKTEEVFGILTDLHKIKMVTPCRGIGSYQEYLYKEYLAYKLYNIITDYSFKVRMLKINYQNTGGKEEIGSVHTFIIEDQNALAKRSEALPIKNEKLNGRLLDEEHAALMFLFQYMIGNTDWSVAGLHNMKLLKLKDPSRPNPIGVPYDFDYSGLVDAVYAIPSDKLPIKDVRERLYFGFCISESTMQNAIDHFVSKKTAIFHLIENFTWLDQKEINSITRYMEEFYDTLENPRRFNSLIVKQCR